MAGIGQAGGDIKNVTQGLTALKTAIAEYGRNSTQAAQAQADLNNTLNSFSPVAKGAVLAASQTAQGFHAMFDQVTGEAEKIGAEIINQAMQVGEKFLPTIGKFATQNLSIIQADIQPFFNWLQNAGPQGTVLASSRNLEKAFQSQLPAGVNALTQGLELFVKTIGVAATQTSGFVTTISNFLTKANTTGFSAWSNEVVEADRTIQDLGRPPSASFGGVIYALNFKPAVGFGEGVCADADGHLHPDQRLAESALHAKPTERVVRRAFQRGASKGSAVSSRPSYPCWKRPPTPSSRSR